MLIGVGLGLAAFWELQTADVQSWLFTRWASTLEYRIERGESPRIAFPHAGPFDERRGYTRLPDFTQSLQAAGFRIGAQARQSPELARLIHDGIAPPFPERPLAGLVIRDASGSVLFDSTAGGRVFRGFNEVPPLIVDTLLFIENRGISDRANPRANPAVDWPRLARAILYYEGRKLHLDLPLEGGSTLATQLQKFQHSPGGRTSSPSEKLRQMLGASLSAYRSGRETQLARREIIVDYLNTMPLSAAPGVGEVQGLGAGLRVWFGLDLEAVSAALNQKAPTLEKARDYRDVLALVYAAHAPTYYLLTHRGDLERRVDAYAKLLHSAGIIDDRLFALVKEVPPQFAAPAPAPPPRPHFIERKAVDAVRVELASKLRVSRLSDLDGLDLQADSTIDGNLQARITRILRQLASPAFVAANGLTGPHLLSRGDPRGVTYSFLLLESRPEGNLVRVNTDTVDAPFDVNHGMKLELGSTAKLRTIAHYLGVMADLYRELAPLRPGELERRIESARDPLTRWAAGTLLTQPGVDLASFLTQALDRRYSASPAEAFFTGGGLHHFHNFEPADNGHILTVREALIHSTNLVFIRLMRDLVRFHEARLPYDTDTVLARSDDPVRRRLLAQIADEETRQSLARAYQVYRGLRPPDILRRLLETRAQSPRALAVVFYAWHRSDGPEHGASFKRSHLDTSSALGSWLRTRLPGMGAAEARRLERAYGNPHLTLADYAYLLREDPLELWCAGQLARDPHVSWDQLLARSEGARHLASGWLFKTRNRKAQDLRLRIRFERDAFARMTPYWRALGFPFETLVPSYATAIGSSADRPAALAELMGIILNDGRRLPTVDMTRLTFGAGTPYQTVFETAPPRGEQVMRPVVARLLRATLAGVVERGTARRLRDVFLTPSGKPIPIGGKTGSGDNRFKTFARGGLLLSAHAVNRTAAFVFYLGDRWFGVITASVDGPQAAAYTFTSSLPLAVLKLLSPVLTQAVDATQPPQRRIGPALPAARATSAASRAHGGACCTTAALSARGKGPR